MGLRENGPRGVRGGAMADVMLEELLRAYPWLVLGIFPAACTMLPWRRRSMAAVQGVARTEPCHCAVLCSMFAAFWACSLHAVLASFPQRMGCRHPARV